MSRDIKNIVDRNELPATSDLLKMEEELNVISVIALEEGDILVKDGTEVLIPKAQMKPMLAKLHATHLSDTSMLKIARGSFLWPGMTLDIREVYETCQTCLGNYISKKKKYC